MAVIERGKALSDLNVEDCTAYRDWLSSLGRTQPDQWPFRLPQEDWIAPRNTPRFSSDWRPFDGALSASSVKHALTILAACLNGWLASSIARSIHGVQSANHSPEPMTFRVMSN